MAFAKIFRMQKTFTVADPALDETRTLFAVKEGWRVLAASARVLTNAAATTDTTVTLGDGVDPDGYIAAIDTEATTGLVNGAGALLASSGGKLYTADDTVDAVYSNGTIPGAVAPVVRFTIFVAKDED